MFYLCVHSLRLGAQGRSLLLWCSVSWRPWLKYWINALGCHTNYRQYLGINALRKCWLNLSCCVLFLGHVQGCVTGKWMKCQRRGGNNGSHQWAQMLGQMLCLSIGLPRWIGPLPLSKHRLIQEGQKWAVLSSSCCFKASCDACGSKHLANPAHFFLHYLSCLILAAFFII